MKKDEELLREIKQVGFPLNPLGGRKREEPP